MAALADETESMPPPRVGAATSSQPVRIVRVHGAEAQPCEDSVAVEEPLEIQLVYGPRDARVRRSIAVTMRTPGNDAELVAGFLLTEGVLFDAADVESIAATEERDARGDADARADAAENAWRDDVAERRGGGGEADAVVARRNRVRVELAPGVQFNEGSLDRNFYTTSSCGICGKASLLALRTVCPPRRENTLRVAAEVLYGLPERLRAEQAVFDRTGGLHACGLFDRDGNLLAVREDVGRHNACDKLLGREFLEDRTPLRDRILLLSGRASFELLQKAVMAGVATVVSVGAPSSLAIAVAREFDVTLAGFLRDRSLNVYYGAERVVGVCAGEETL